MIEYILLAIAKICDNVISTFKSIATYKEEKLLSSILTVLSQLIFYLLISRVINDSTILAIIIVAISSGIGNYIAFRLSEKFKHDDKWTIVLTSNNKEDVMRFCDYLTQYKIKHVANHGINRKGESAIHIIAFSKTKNESRLIEDYLKNTDSKYLKEII